MKASLILIAIAANSVRASAVAGYGSHMEVARAESKEVEDCPTYTEYVTCEGPPPATTTTPSVPGGSGTTTSPPSTTTPAGDDDEDCDDDDVPLTTSTIYTTSTSTISECPQTVTDCPYATKPVVTTLTIVVSTTVCPVSEVQATETAAPVMTTSIVYATKTSTIYECPETVDNCPYKMAPLTTTVTYPAYTSAYAVPTKDISTLTASSTIVYTESLTHTIYKPTVPAGTAQVASGYAKPSSAAVDVPAKTKPTTAVVASESALTAGVGRVEISGFLMVVAGFAALLL